MDLGGFSIFVSGFPRSGTSMVMRMLNKGQVPILWKEHQGHISEWDPHGIYEFKDVASELSSHAADWTANKAVKLVSIYLADWLPLDRPTKVIFTLRDQTEIITSLLAKRLIISEDITGSINEARRYLEQHRIPVLYLQYREVLKYPKTAAIQIANFLEADLDTAEMAKAIDRDVRTRKAKDLGPLISMRAEDYMGHIELRVNLNKETIQKLREEGVDVPGYQTNAR